MAKQITARELAEIVTAMLIGTEIDDADQFGRFMQDIAQVVCDHCGGTTETPASCMDDGSPDDWMVSIHADENLPADGGVWKKYDTDVAFIDGVEAE